ncbi:MAG TPA: hypothetical protein PLD47_18165 [Aggregatilineales bacterium]|nr:hypothetical protein [Anaerolineales bacterium]HRE49655.1 hypothetical protein [Aggregatilineales bacterium]
MRRNHLVACLIRFDDLGEIYNALNDLKKSAANRLRLEIFAGSVLCKVEEGSGTSYQEVQGGATHNRDFAVENMQRYLAYT